MGISAKSVGNIHSLYSMSAGMYAAHNVYTIIKDTHIIPVWCNFGCGIYILSTVLQCYRLLHD